MNPVPFIIWGLLAAVCFTLCAKGFSDEGLPFTSNIRIKGSAGKIVGSLCALFGVACIGFIIVIALARSR